MRVAETKITVHNLINILPSEKVCRVRYGKWLVPVLAGCLSSRATPRVETASIDNDTVR